jgi:hypothetical protein
LLLLPHTLSLSLPARCLSTLALTGKEKTTRGTGEGEKS